MSADTPCPVRLVGGGAELVDRLEPLWLALHAHHQSVDPRGIYFDDSESWRVRRSSYVRWLAEPGSFVLIAQTEAGEDIGYALVAVTEGPDDTWVTDDRLAEVESLAVLPAHRGSGVGTRLLDAVDAELDRLGIGDLFIAALAQNTEAIRFYEKRGLRPVLTKLARFRAERR
ncbi:GNAT family N-acetyltransferase [Streptomyces sp. NPDC004752]